MTSCLYSLLPSCPYLFQPTSLIFSLSFHPISSLPQPSTSSSTPPDHHPFVHLIVQDRVLRAESVKVSCKQSARPGRWAGDIMTHRCHSLTFVCQKSLCESRESRLCTLLEERAGLQSRLGLGLSDVFMDTQQNQAWLLSHLGERPRPPERNSRADDTPANTSFIVGTVIPGHWKDTDIKLLSPLAGCFQIPPRRSFYFSSFFPVGFFWSPVTTPTFCLRPSGVF